MCAQESDHCIGKDVFVQVPARVVFISLFLTMARRKTIEKLKKKKKLSRKEQRRLSGKQSRQFLTYDDKISILNEIEEGKSRDYILKKYGIKKTCFLTIIRYKDKVTSLSNKAEFKNKRSKRSCKDRTLEDCLFTWLLQERALRQPVTGPILQAKALELNTSLNGPSDFKASNGWLDCFKNRRGIQITTEGDIQYNNSEAIKIFCDEIRDKIETENFLLENVYNVDESSIFWKSFPDSAAQKERASENRQTDENKDRQDRITTIFCCNATGSNKIKLCLIGKFPQPRSIKNVKKLPVVYKWDDTARMNQELFIEWYREDFIPAVLEYQKKSCITGKVLLLLDHAPFHVPARELNKIHKKFEVKHIPPNIAATIQPMNQGTISMMKKLYKKEFLFKLLFIEEEQSENIETYVKNFTLRDFINLISNAWNNIKSSTLRKTWKPMLGSLLESAIEDEEDKIVDEINNDSFNELSKHTCQQLKENDYDVVEVKDWFAIEEGDEGWPNLTDAEIIENVANYPEFENGIYVENNPESSSKRHNGQIDGDTFKGISHSQAYRYLLVIKDWSQQQEECELTDTLVIDKMLGIAAAKSMSEI